MLEKTAKFLTNWVIIISALFLLIKSYLPTNEADSDFTYLYYYISRTRVEITIIAIIILFLLNRNWFSILGYKELNKIQIIVLLFVFLITSGVIFILQRKDLYGIAVQKKLFYSHTIPNDYFKFLLFEANRLEEKGNLSGAKTYYLRLLRQFPNNEDTELINDRIKRIENRKALSNKYYKIYEKEGQGFSRNKIKNLIYAFYLNPNSEQIRNTIRHEYKTLKIHFSKLEKYTNFPNNYCSLLKFVNKEPMAQFIYDKRMKNLNYSNLDLTDCFPIQIPSKKELKKYLYLDDLTEIMKIIEN